MKTFAAALLCMTGCYVTTGTTTTTRKLGVENGASVPGKIDHVTLAASAADRDLTVRAVASRTCTRPVNHVFEVRTEEHLRMGGADDARARVFGAILAPVTLPVSLVVAGLAMAPDQVTKQSKLDHNEQIACTTPADALPIAIELPSGARETATTDARGELMYKVPLSEPYAGTITVTSGDLSREVVYSAPKPALVDAREAMAACGARAATLALALDITGKVTHVWAAGDAGDVGACVLRRLARVSFPFHDQTIELPFGSARAVDTARRIEAVCAVVDTHKDQLPEAEQARSQRVLARVLEEQNLLVVDTGCGVTYSLWQEPVGTGFTVHLRNAVAARHTTVSAADVPAAYAQLLAALVELGEKARAPVDVEPTAIEPSVSTTFDTEPAAERGPGFLYARLGTGSVTGLGAGLRYRPGTVGVDASAFIGGGDTTTAGGIRVQLLAATNAGETAWYAGAGFSLGGTSWATNNGYMESSGSGGGVAFESSVGYEFPLGHARSFFQADVSTPLYSAVDDSGASMSVPHQIVVSWGIGARVF